MCSELSRPSDILAAEAAGRDGSEPLLRAPKGGRWSHCSWVRGWKKACAAAGVQGLRTHDLRHAYISWALAAGSDPKAVQESAGHASGAMTIDVYGHTLPGRLEAVAEAIDPMIRKLIGELGEPGHEETP